MMGVSDFANAAKNRRTANGGPNDLKAVGVGGIGSGQAHSGNKGGMIGPNGVVNTDEVIPYNS